MVFLSVPRMIRIFMPPCDLVILLVIPLEFQGIKHQPFSGDAFHCAGSAATFTAANVPLKQGQMNDL